MKPAPAAEMSPDDLLELALQVSGAAPTVDAGDLGPEHVRALCRLLTSFAQDLSAAEGRAASWAALAGSHKGEAEAAERDNRALQEQIADATNRCDRLAAGMSDVLGGLEKQRARADGLAAQLEQARQAIADREDEIARTNNLRQAEALDAGEQRQRADNAEAAAEVFEATARAALALVARPGTVDLAELVRAVDGRLSRALEREKTVRIALETKLEETLRRIEESQDADRLRSAMADACLGITGQTIARVNLQLDEELAAHPDVGPLHHARDQREPEDLDAYRSRVGAQLDEHFERMRPVTDAINAGFAATRPGKGT